MNTLTYRNILGPITFCLTFAVAAFSACQNTSDEVSMAAEDCVGKPIEQWYILGGLSPATDSICQELFNASFETIEKIENSDSASNLWFNGTYSPKFNLLDLREVLGFADQEGEERLRDRYFYLICDLYSNADANRFLNVTSAMHCEHFVNGEKLLRCDIQGLDFYPVHLSRGKNRYVAKVSVVSDESSFEAVVMDSLTVASQFVNGQSNNILFPQILPSNKNATLTNTHWNLLNGATILLTDVSGDVLCTFPLEKDSLTYPVPMLCENTAYMCTMILAGKTVRQPIVCGSYAELFARFRQMRRVLADNHPRCMEIDQVLYRIEFLLNHESRHTDWWWQFKLPPLFYQLEHTFAHLDKAIGQDSNEFNVQFVTYVSELDGGQQRYLLVTPDSVHNGRRYPLVVIVRPHVANHYPFFTSPQFAHQWAINIIQSLANQHGFVVMMPEMRTYQNEDMIPFAEAEMKLALADVKRRFNIDEDRIYLHGICSGGYRALKMAALNPKMFAAVGLYAPTYHQPTHNGWETARSLESNLPNLAGTPVLLFADPNDRHTPFEVYADLIADCEKYGIPLTFTQKINTELLYNAVVAGREAFEFFDGKCRDKETPSNKRERCEIAVSDLYSQPFTYVYCHDNHSSFYLGALHSMQHVYEHYMDSPMPLVSDEKIDEQDIVSRNLFLVGDHFCNPLLMQLVSSANDGTEHNHSQISIHYNPSNWQKRFVICRISPSDSRIMRFPWIDGTQQRIEFDTLQ